MKNFVFIVAAISLINLASCSDEANAQNLVRQYVRSYSYGDTHAMNNTYLQARNPNLYLSRGRYSNQYDITIRFNQGIVRDRYGVRIAPRTSLDAPIRRDYYYNRKPVGRINIYSPR